MRDRNHTAVLTEDDGTLGASLQDVLDFCNSELASLHLKVRDAYTETGVQVTGRRPNTWISAAPPLIEPVVVDAIAAADTAVTDDVAGDATTQGSDDDDDEQSIAIRRSELMCPITQELLVDPVVAQDGFTYERSAILEWFNKCAASGEMTSPLTNAPLTSAQLFDNNMVRSMVVSCHVKRIVGGS